MIISRIFKRLWLAANFFCLISVQAWSQNTPDAPGSSGLSRRSEYVPFTLGFAIAGFGSVTGEKLTGPTLTRMLGVTGQHHFRMYSGNPFITWTVGIAKQLPLPFVDVQFGTYIGKRQVQPFVGAGLSTFPQYIFGGGGVAFRKRILLSGLVYRDTYDFTYSLRLSIYPRFRSVSLFSSLPPHN